MHHARVRDSSGFTLVELLVVIAIIGVLVALLLPAVQAAREAARRMQCGNSLKQIGLALHNYHSTYNLFPTGIIQQQADPDFVPNGGNINTPVESWGWAALMLPFIEQGPLHDQGGIGRGQLMQNVITTVPLTRIATYRCPSDNAPPVRQNVGFSVRYAPWATSNYKANCGHAGCGADSANNTGLFWRNNCRIGMHDIIDGTSNTIAVGEIRWVKPLANGTQLRYQAAVWAGCIQGQQGNCVDDTLASGRAAINHQVNNADQLAESFSSHHSGGGANFVLCDGSVRFISQDINFIVDGPSNGSPVDSTYERLLARSDGQPIGEY